MELVDVIRAQNSPHPNPPREGGLNEGIDFNNIREYRQTADLKNYEQLKANSRSNRHMPTEAEGTLWQLLRNNSTGYKVRRQHAIDNYIADFICLQKGLVIEVDGKYHEHIKEADSIRTDALNHWGFEVIRFDNDEVLAQPQKVFDEIRNKINSMPDRKKALPPGEGLGGATESVNTGGEV
ncbi:endonuclease domain-containing protein [Mucilaginibacter aquatilis]|uniref:endonuclease domain-containing protein n=1 Tax=Mucilaginibacter aquatilis TaxID=1517760 RepID=UPI0018DC50B8|nr:DUF559 domain-containing protein [Mucilaginibacter aquatilis]